MTIRSISSRVNSNYQVTIPKLIREHLHLKCGDSMIFEILSDNTVILESMMSEWDSVEDNQAYKDL